MTKKRFSLPENMTPQARNAISINAVLLVILFLFDIYSVYNFLTYQTPLLLFSMFLSYAMTGVSIFAVLLILRRRESAAGWLLMIGSLTALLLSNILSEGLGVVYALTGVIVVSAIASSMLPQRQTGWALFISAVVGVLGILADIFEIRPPINTPVPPTVTYTLLILLIIAQLFLARRQLNTYSLRTKLVIAFLLVALIPMSAVFYINNRATTQNLTASADASVKGAAGQAAAALDSFFDAGLSDAHTAAQLHSWETYLALPLAERAGSAAEAAVNNDLRAISSRDQTYITSVGLIDIHGISVADTVTAEVGVDKSTRNYFLGPFKTKLPYVSPVEFSLVTGGLSLYFSAPVRNSVENIIGVIRIRYNAVIIQNIIKTSAEKANLSALTLTVFDENHIRLADNQRPDLILQSVVPLSKDKAAELKTERRLPPDQSITYLTMNTTNNQVLEQGLNNVDEKPFFVAEFHKAGAGNDEGTALHIVNQPWLVAAGQNRQVFLAPLTAQTREAAIAILVIAILATIAAIVVARSIANPIEHLKESALLVSDGNLTVETVVETQDEIGQLAGAFNQMTRQLRNLIASLEQRVNERTQALTTSTEVSRRLSTILDQKYLVAAVVEEIQTAFNYYHVHIYLLDQHTKQLIMMGGTGEAGQTMLREGHKIAYGKGIVGQAAEMNKVVLASDVSNTPDWLPNPLLPETRSEIAVPISIADEVLGVLDVQHNIVGGLQQEDADLLESIANQVAFAIRNAQSYSELQTQAKSEMLIGSIGQKILNANTLEDTIQVAARELGRALNVQETRVVLKSNKNISNKN
jgi:putative methionine-R-sulfoxide reductase with GAF domain